MRTRKIISIVEMIVALVLMYWAGMQPTPVEPPAGTVFLAVLCGLISLITLGLFDD